VQDKQDVVEAVQRRRASRAEKAVLSTLLLSPQFPDGSTVTVADADAAYPEVSVVVATDGMVVSEVAPETDLVPRPPSQPEGSGPKTPVTARAQRPVSRRLRRAQEVPTSV
jgi:hypothetical protein